MTDRHAARGPGKGLTRTFAAAAALLAVASAPLNAHADNRTCISKVSDVEVSPWGLVVANTGLGWLYFCNLDATVTVYLLPNEGGATQVTPKTCEAWLSMLLTAKTTQQNMTWVIDFGSASAPTCENLVTNWAYPSPFPYFFGFGG